MSSLLESVIAYHGGWELWRGIDFLTARLRFGGLAFASRFCWLGSREREITVSTREPYTIMEDFAGPGLRGFFRAERVWIENVHGECLADRSMPRAAFGSFRRQIWWDNLDLLYFAGYAAWNYLTFPFVLASAEEVQELEVWSEQGEIWQRLRVRFPKQLPTHSREQVFYFDEHFRLRRFDYDPFVYASWARAAHYCSHYKEFGGLLAPTRRRVLPRRPDGRSRPWPTLVWIEISNVSLKGVERPTNESQHLERR